MADEKILKHNSFRIDDTAGKFKKIVSTKVGIRKTIAKTNN